MTSRVNSLQWWNNTEIVAVQWVYQLHIGPTNCLFLMCSNVFRKQNRKKYRFEIGWLFFCCCCVFALFVVPLKLADWFVVRIKSRTFTGRTFCMDVQFIWNVRVAQMKLKWNKNKLYKRYVYLCDHTLYWASRRHLKNK